MHLRVVNLVRYENLGLGPNTVGAQPMHCHDLNLAISSIPRRYRCHRVTCSFCSNTIITENGRARNFVRHWPLLPDVATSGVYHCGGSGVHVRHRTLGRANG